MSKPKAEFNLGFIVSDDGQWYCNYVEMLEIAQYVADELGQRDSQKSVGTFISLLEGMREKAEEGMQAPPGETQH